MSDLVTETTSGRNMSHKGKGAGVRVLVVVGWSGVCRAAEVWARRRKEAEEEKGKNREKSLKNKISKRRGKRRKKKEKDESNI